MSVVMVTHLISVILGLLHFSDLILSLSGRLTCSLVSARRRLNDDGPTTDGMSLISVKMNLSGKNISHRYFIE